MHSHALTSNRSFGAFSFGRFSNYQIVNHVDPGSCRLNPAVLGFSILINFAWFENKKKKRKKTEKKTFFNRMNI